METRLTLRPRQNGTKKLLARFGERLVWVRYLYDPETGTRRKTVELIVDSAPWHPYPRRRRWREDEIVGVRIEWPEVELHDRSKRLGELWWPPQKLWDFHLPMDGSTMRGVQLVACWALKEVPLYVSTRSQEDH